VSLSRPTGKAILPKWPNHKHLWNTNREFLKYSINEIHLFVLTCPPSPQLGGTMLIPEFQTDPFCREQGLNAGVNDIRVGPSHTCDFHRNLRSLGQYCIHHLQNACGNRGIKRSSVWRPYSHGTIFSWLPSFWKFLCPCVMVMTDNDCSSSAIKFGVARLQIGSEGDVTWAFIVTFLIISVNGQFTLKGFPDVVKGASHTVTCSYPGGSSYIWTTPTGVSHNGAAYSFTASLNDHEGSWQCEATVSRVKKTAKANLLTYCEYIVYTFLDTGYSDALGRL
jgi:hypothetical protein